MMTIAITIVTMATQFIRIEDGHDIEKFSMYFLERIKFKKAPGHHVEKSPKFSNIQI